MDNAGSLNPDIDKYYRETDEGGRLLSGLGELELIRVRELLRRHLPEAPAAILDVGGGTGMHALWLAREGYEVNLIDAHEPHVEAARAASAQQREAPLALCEVGDARKINRIDGSADAVLLFGPLYHLTEATDRMTALREAHRVLAPDGLLFAIAISRYATTFDGFRRRRFEDPAFQAIARRDRKGGQHRNDRHHPEYFTTAYLHRPEDLAAEIEEASFKLQALLALQGLAALLTNSDFDDIWADQQEREHLLEVVRSMESEQSVLGLSNHIMAVARK